MFLEESLRQAAVTVRRRPALVATGAVLALAHVVVVLGLYALRGGLLDHGWNQYVFAPLSWTGADIVTWMLGPSLFVFVVPLYVSVYGPIRSGADGTTTFRAGAASVRESYGRLLRTALVVGGKAVVAGGLAVLVARVVLTVVQYYRYVTGTPPEPYGQPQLFRLWTVFVSGTLVGLAVGRFADLFALDGRSPRMAWRSSLWFARERPIVFGGYHLAGLVLFVVPLAAGVAAGVVAILALNGGLVVRSPAGPLPSVVGQLLSILLGAAGLLTLLVGLGLSAVLPLAFHAAFFERVVGPATPVPSATTLTGHVGRTRVAVAALVLVAAVGGAAVVRAGEVGADDRAAPREPLPEDPVAAYAAARTNTVDGNHRAVTYIRNNSDPDAEFEVVYREATDYRDNRAWIRFDPDTTDEGSGHRGLYASDAVNAQFTTVEPYPIERNGLSTWFTRRVADGNGTWEVTPANGYSTSGKHAPTPDPDLDWRVVENDATTVVLSIADNEALHHESGLSSYFLYPEDAGNDSYLGVYVDKERGVVEKWRARSTGTVTSDRIGEPRTTRRRNITWRVAIDPEARVERPQALGSKGPVEWLWGVAYY